VSVDRNSVAQTVMALTGGQRCMSGRWARAGQSDGAWIANYPWAWDLAGLCGVCVPAYILPGPGSYQSFRMKNG